MQIMFSSTNSAIIYSMSWAEKQSESDWVANQAVPTYKNWQNDPRQELSDQLLELHERTSSETEVRNQDRHHTKGGSADSLAVVGAAAAGLRLRNDGSDGEWWLKDEQRSDEREDAYRDVAKLLDGSLGRSRTQERLRQEYNSLLHANQHQVINTTTFLCG